MSSIHTISRANFESVLGKGKYIYNSTKDQHRLQGTPIYNLQIGKAGLVAVVKEQRTNKQVEAFFPGDLLVPRINKWDVEAPPEPTNNNVDVKSDPSPQTSTDVRSEGKPAFEPITQKSGGLSALLQDPVATVKAQINKAMGKEPDNPISTTTIVVGTGILLFVFWLIFKPERE